MPHNELNILVLNMSGRKRAEIKRKIEGRSLKLTFSNKKSAKEVSRSKIKKSDFFCLINSIEQQLVMTFYNFTD